MVLQPNQLEDGMIRVFVYGTLKKGHGNNAALKNSQFLGRATIEGNLTLISMGWYPGLVRAGERQTIYGEVYAIDEDTLHTLDLIEGHPNFYERRKFATKFKNAWVYTLDETFAQGAEPITGGVWEPSDEEREYVNACNQEAD